MAAILSAKLSSEVDWMLAAPASGSSSEDTCGWLSAALASWYMSQSATQPTNRRLAAVVRPFQTKERQVSEQAEWYIMCYIACLTACRSLCRMPLCSGSRPKAPTSAAGNAGADLSYTFASLPCQNLVTNANRLQRQGQKLSVSCAHQYGEREASSHCSE